MAAKKAGSSLDFIREQLGSDGFANFCVGNAMEILYGYSEEDNKVGALEEASEYILQAIDAMSTSEAPKTAAKKSSSRAASAPQPDDTESFAANGGEYNDDGWS